MTFVLGFWMVVWILACVLACEVGALVGHLNRISAEFRDSDDIRSLYASRRLEGVPLSRPRSAVPNVKRPQ